MAKKIVFTGGLSSGKTTTINALRNLGYGIVDECSEKMINSFKEKYGCYPWEDKNNILNFHKKVFSKQLKNEEGIKDDTVFLDRSLIDQLAFFEFDGLPIPEEFLEIAKRTKYNLVIFFEGNPAIYKNDRHRPHDISDSEKIKRLIMKKYKTLGYNLALLPFCSIEERVNMVKNMLINYNQAKDCYQYNKDSVNFFINVGFVVTRRCNLKCIHCCEILGFEDYDLERTKRIVDRLYEGGLRKICITGGEPLMGSDIIEVLKYANDKGLLITFSTNGTMLSKELLQKIRPLIHNIRFSLYGKEKTHDKITLIAGNYKKVENCLKLTNELKIPSGIIVTVMKSNLSDLKDVLSVCNENGVTKLYLFSLMPTARGKEIYEDEYVSPELIKEEVSKINNPGNTCEVKIIDWRIEGQCVLAYENGDIVAQPSYKDTGNKKIVGNILKEEPSSIWEKYPFKNSHIDYYLDYH